MSSGSSDIRQLLLRVIEDRLIAALLEHGFRTTPLSENDQRSHELRMSFPFGCLKRARGVNLDLIEIQLDKQGAAKFVINLGVAPPSGVTLPWANIEQGKASVSDLPEWYRLYSFEPWLRWFSPAWFPIDAGGRVNRAVDKSVRLLPEAEAYFSTGVVGSHMRRTGYPVASLGVSRLDAGRGV